MDSRGESPSRLSDLLTPVAVDDFLSAYWRTRHLLCHGPCDRFSTLLSWPILNATLARHWREPLRFRLTLRGRDLDAASYADLDGDTPRVRPTALIDHLRQGATLSFHAIDEVHEPLMRLVEALEECFRASTQINVYAGWRAVHGLDLHRDDEEVFILQLDGRKRWLLYGFVVDDVDRGDSSRTSVPPPGAEVDQVLTPGDLLYVPRGCYHLAIPMNEPTLHLTIGVKNSAESGVQLKRRPSFNLPWSATLERLPPASAFRVRLQVRARLASVVSTAGSVEMRCAGSGDYRFPSGMQWIVEALNDGAPVAMDRLIVAVAGKLDEDMVRLLVAMLVKENLVSIIT